VDEREELIGELLARLIEMGVPSGLWLVELSTARRELSETFERVDYLLGRLQETLLRDLERQPFESRP
jgi:hypothetical protein